MNLRLPLSRRALLCAAILGSPSGAAAQGGSEPESRPDAPASRSTAPTAASWIGTPLRFSTPDFDVVVTTPLSRAWLAVNDDPKAAARACPGLDVAPRDTAAGAEFIDWNLVPPAPAAEVASAAAQSDAVIITIAPTTPAESPCRGYPARTPGAIAAGVAFQRYRSHNPARDMSTAQVRVNGLVDSTLRIERGIQRVLMPKSVPEGRPTPSVIRIFVRPETFAADPDGELRRIDIDLRRWNDGLGFSLSLPLDVRRQVHQDLLATGNGNTATAGRAPRLALPASTDAALRRAVELQESGETRAAAAAYHARLYEPGLDAASRRETMVRLALSLAALGDSSAARVIGARIVEREPCFRIAPSLPQGARDLFRSARAPRARCADSVNGVATRALMLPGLGHAYTGRRRAALGVALASGVVFGAALERDATSRSHYERYLAARSATESELTYAQAMDTRNHARIGALVGASIWILSAVEATMAERRHAAAMRVLRDYGRIDVTAAPRQGGVAVVIRRP